MATAVWTGSISLGMVVVPVRLYPAIRKKAVRFHELDRGGRRVRHVRVSEPEPEPEMKWEPPTRLAERAPWPEAGLVGRADFAERRSPVVEQANPEVAFEEIRKGYEVAPGRYVSMTREEL